ncbi:MAG: hypothetical protein OEM63_13540, partial [Gammaproteobacteria bacterium]|nr:hypothetical protein [Gammaproteobacteria bacterium]
ALALGRGYAREVQRVIDRVYAEAERMPCASDNFLDPNSFLHSANRDLRKMLSIELLECGRFVVTVHEPIDGVRDGQLLYVASPGDADAGKPLEWQCISAHHEGIEALTNGGCTYDGALANTLPSPAERPTSAARSASLAPASAPAVASVTARPSAPPRQSGPNLQEHLDRLAEPTLWEDCGSETTSYRLLKFDADQYVAAVRISHDSKTGAFRSVSSSSPDKSIGLDGWVDDRTWGRLEADFAAAGFWNLQNEQRSGGPDGSHVYLEACKNGTYHAVKRESGNSSIASISRTFARVGKLEWLGD